MKSNFIVFLAVAAVAQMFFYSCKKDEIPTDEAIIKFSDSQDISVTPAATEIDIYISSSESWNFESGDNSWLKIAGFTEKQDKCTDKKFSITLEANNSKDDRTSTIIITNKSGKTAQKKILQFGNNYSASTFTSFSFKSSLNKSISEDVEATISGNEIIVDIPYFLYDLNLTPTFSHSGSRVTVRGNEQKSEQSKVNFSFPVKYSIVDANGVSTDYKVVIKSESNNLPIISIEVNGIIDRNVYSDINFHFNGNGEFADLEQAATIKGRGNITWTYPKKPLKIKFPEKVSLGGLTKAKDWVLLANYNDPTKLMNAVAFEFSRILEMPYTNHIVFTDLYVNGVYVGSYTMTEQIEVKKGRVDIDKTLGFLVEIDDRFDEDWKFNTDILKLPVQVKAPDITTESDMQFVKNAFTELENALFVQSNGFPNNNYRDIIDVTSMMNLCFVNEITYNGEVLLGRSIYMYKDNGGKFFMGPVWDFDAAFNFNGAPNSYFGHQGDFQFRPTNPDGQSYGKILTTFLFFDPEYKQGYYERWKEFYPKFNSIYDFIDTNAAKIKKSAERDLQFWEMNYYDFDTEIEEMKDFLRYRMDRLNGIIEDGGFWEG